MAVPPDDTVTIVLGGDSQRFYEEAELFVKKVNTIKDLDFVLIAGDISDFGLLAEFEWVIERLNKLNKPYIGVIGNHDIVANGEEVFKRTFGPLDFSFVYDSIKFILHNTNGQEYEGNNVPDLVWLENELKPSPGVKHFIGVSHVPPFSGDFNKTIETNYATLLENTPAFLLSLHGHTHMYSDGYPYEDGVRYITTPHFEARQFILLKICRGNVNRTLVSY